MRPMFLLAAAGIITFGPLGRFELEYSNDSFGPRSHGVNERIGPNRIHYYPLPQSTPQDYVRLRPQDFKLNPFTATAGNYDRQEVIGPSQIDGGKLWFGNNFYDSEGSRGVGAFGYFDTNTRKYTLFRPPEVAPYEVGAILVEPQTVWLALDQFIEDISKVPGGLAKWDRDTHHLQKYPLEFVIESIQRQGHSLRLTTHNGYALFRDGQVHRFLTNGRPIAKFPPPPTHY